MIHRQCTLYGLHLLIIYPRGLFSVLAENINLGSMAENLVYLSLRKHQTVRYHRTSGLEVDFVLGKKAWEVKYKDMIDEKDLTGIKNLRNMKSKYVVTRKKEGKVKDIKLKPLWKFLLHE